MKFIQITSADSKLCQTFKSLMLPYMRELDSHHDNYFPLEVQQKWIQSIIDMQGPADRHLELCYDNDTLIGFLYGKVDHEEHRGFIKPGYGYIMEFYVLPEHRRKGYGKMMYLRLENHFRHDGVKNMYLTADPITGKPFWEAMGFRKNGEISSDNHLEIYEKEIAWANYALVPLTQSTAEEISHWQYEKPYDMYSFHGHSNDYLLDQTTWGIEQFCLMNKTKIAAHVACQYDRANLWVGWSLSPFLCGKGQGSSFVLKCIEEIRNITKHTGSIFLRVAASNQRAVKAYQTAGFILQETVVDEVAYSNHTEDFYIMKWKEK